MPRTLSAGARSASGAAHVGTHPAGVQGRHDDAALAQVERQPLHHHVQRRLAAAVGVVAAGRVAGDAAHQTADTNDPLLVASGDVVDETFDHARRRQDVDGEDVGPGGVVDVAEPHLVGAVDAGVVEQHVDGFVVQLLGEGGDAAVVGDFEGVDGGAAVRPVGGGLQLGGGGGVAAAGEHAPAGRGVLAGELQAQAAVRPGDEDARHDHLRNGLVPGRQGQCSRKRATTPNRSTRRGVPKAADRLTSPLSLPHPEQLSIPSRQKRSIGRNSLGS